MARATFFASARRTTRLVGGALLFFLAHALACAKGNLPAAPVFSADRPAGALDIRLVFGDAADLDLFVTDPTQETLYFGNDPARNGGRLDLDQRCGSAAPRIETARFEPPRAGRYRVGVSYDRSCRFRRRPASFAIEVEADMLSLSHAGEIEPGRFEAIVLEFDWPGVPPRVVQERAPESGVAD